MEIVKLCPTVHTKLWGGTKLEEEYGYKATTQKDGELPGEAWLLSCHADGPCFVTEGEFQGMSLLEVLQKVGKGVLGTHAAKIEGFPILIKIIDAHDKLSVQVHPGDEYARRVEHENGKTEAWFVLSAKPGAELVYGLNKDITREEFLQHTLAGELTNDLQFVPVKAGDVVFIPSGMLHAIGEGILLAEVQQSSNTTYRAFDYNRLQSNGTLRELHIQKSADVVSLEIPHADFSAMGKPQSIGNGTKTLLTECQFFSMRLLEINGKAEQTATEESFVSLLVLNGSGTLTCGSQTLALKKGDSIFIPAGSGNYTVTGECRILQTEI